MVLVKNPSKNFLGADIATPKYPRMTNIDAVLKQIYIDNPFVVQFIKNNLEAVLLDYNVTIEPPCSYTNVKYRICIEHKKTSKKPAPITTESINNYMAIILMDVFKRVEDEFHLFTNMINKTISRAPENIVYIWTEVLEEYKKLINDKSACMMLFRVQNYINLNTIIIELGQ